MLEVAWTYPQETAALASATSQPHEVPPAVGLRRRQVPAAGGLGTRAPREHEQERGCRSKTSNQRHLVPSMLFPWLPKQM